MPPQTRTSLCSSAICAKLLNCRDRRASAMSVVTKLSGPPPEEGFENASSGPGVDSGLGRIFRVHRRGVQGQPTRVAFGGVIPVLIAIADRRDGPPKVVLEFGVPIHNEAVGEGHRHQRE